MYTYCATMMVTHTYYCHGSIIWSSKKQWGIFSETIKSIGVEAVVQTKSESGKKKEQSERKLEITRREYISSSVISRWCSVKVAAAATTGMLSG